MVAKTDYIGKLAVSLLAIGAKMTFDQLAVDLNNQGLLTSYRSQYVGGRGVAKLVHAIWDRLDAQGRDTERDAVELTFTDAYGNYAYY